MTRDLPGARRDRFDLDQLARVAEDGDAEQGTRRLVVAERRLDDVPRRDKIRPIDRCDIDCGLEHVGQRRTRRRQGGNKIR